MTKKLIIVSSQGKVTEQTFLKRVGVNICAVSFDNKNH
jgi:hypothetical protein